MNAIYGITVELDRTARASRVNRLHSVSYWGLATAGRPAGIVARHRDYGLFSDILAQSDNTNCRTKFVPWNLTEEAVCYLLVASAFLHL